MKYKVFKKLCQTIVHGVNESSKRDKKLELALGGDTTVMTEDDRIYYEGIEAALELEFNDSFAKLNWIIWEVKLSPCINNDMMFEEDNIKYAATYKNVYLSLTNNLNELTGKLYNEKENNQ